MRFSNEHRTERLTLRRPTAADVDDVYRIHSDPRVWEHSPHEVHVDRAQSEAMLAHWLRHWTLHGFGYWLADHDGFAVYARATE